MIFLIRGEIKPYVRMTQKGKFSDPYAMAYLSQKQALRIEMRNAMEDSGEPMLPGQTSLEVIINIHRKPLHKCDLDNLVKALLDAGNKVIYPDDMWIDYIRAGRTLADGDQYAIFEIRRADKPVEPCQSMEVIL